MSKPLRVLLLEESDDVAAVEMVALQRGGFAPSFKRVATFSEMTAALDRQRWDLVISAYLMPGFGCLQALQLVKQRDPDIPFIIVSGVQGEERAVEAMKAGASDYVMRNGLGRLARSVERELQETASYRVGREAQAAAWRTEQELTDFFENAPVGLYWTGPEGAILKVNWAAAEMLGHGHFNLVGHRISEIFLADGEAEKAFAVLRSGHELTNFETRLRCKNGGPRPARINANSRCENGTFVRTRWFVQAIAGEEACR